jgi:hypothetical protein
MNWARAFGGSYERSWSGTVIKTGNARIEQKISAWLPKADICAFKYTP